MIEGYRASHPVIGGHLCDIANLPKITETLKICPTCGSRYEYQRISLGFYSIEKWTRMEPIEVPDKKTWGTKDTVFLFILRNC